VFRSRHRERWSHCRSVYHVHPIPNLRARRAVPRCILPENLLHTLLHELLSTSPVFPYNWCPVMRPSLNAYSHKSLRFSPSEDEAAVVINILIEFRSASLMNSRNATCVGEDSDVLSGGIIVAVLASTCGLILLWLAMLGCFGWFFGLFFAILVRFESCPFVLG
jgi:hypothetical protein